MLRVRSLICGIIIAILLLSLIPVQSEPANAQADTAPIVLWAEGDYWRYYPATNSVEQITTWGWNSFPIISPDSTHIAYSSTAAFVVDYINENGGIGGGALPSNIWVLNIATGDAFRPADQAPGATFDSGDTLYMRSNPTWSPDGLFLAWTELRSPNMENYLAIYNMLTGETKFSTIDGQMYGVPAPLPIEWGDGGIAVQSFAFNEQLNVVTERYHIFDYNGTPLGALVPNTGDAGGVDFTWIKDGVTDYLGVLDTDGIWHLLNPKTGIETTYIGNIELYNPLFPERHRLQVFPQETQNMGDTLGAYVTAPNIPSTLLPNSSALLNYYTISPTGNAVAYSIFGNAGSFVWSNGNLQNINLDKTVTSLVWGYGQWRLADGGIVGNPVSQTYQEPIACITELPSRLTVGRTAHVSLTGGANNMRDTASVNGLVVVQIPEGANFDVVEGPICDDGLAWWQVNYNGATGWTAEGSGIDYWLVPGPNTTIAPSLQGAVLEVTQFGSPVVARQGVSRAEAEVETLYWGDRVLWTGNIINNQTLVWFEVYLGSGQLAYVEDTGAFTVEDPGYQTSGIFVGGAVTVTAEGAGMHLRTNTSTYATEVATLNQGDSLSIIAGPFYSEYFVWWQFQTSGGLIGYAVDVAGWLNP